MRKFKLASLPALLGVLVVMVMIAFYFFNLISEYVVLLLLAVAFTSSTIKNKKLARKVRVLETELQRYKSG